MRRARETYSDSSRASPEPAPLQTAASSRRNTRPSSIASSSRLATPAQGNEEDGDSTDARRQTGSKISGKRSASQQEGRVNKKQRVIVRPSIRQQEGDSDEQDMTGPSRSTSPASIRQVKSRPFTPVTTRKREVPVFLTNYSEEWEERHWEKCEACSSTSDKFVYCQGCAVAVHLDCILVDRKRHHLVRIDTDAWVLQCRYCVSKSDKPGGSRSYITGKIGPACEPFISPKAKWQPPTAGQVISDPEQAARDADAARVEKEQNALREAIHKPENVMFRCTRCLRPALYEDLPADDGTDGDPAQCLDCNLHAHLKVHHVLGFRELSERMLESLEVTKAEAPSDWLHEYLVKWQDQSYRTVEWVPATWLAGFAHAKKRNFDQKEIDPIKEISDVVLNEWTNVEVLLDAEYEGGKSFDQMGFESEEQAFAAIRQVTRMYVKWQQVQYEDVCWDEPPSEPKEIEGVERDRWAAFEFAYRDWVRGFYVMVDKQHAVKSAKLNDFQFVRLEKKEQPKNLVGGELMPYQLEGLNWLYYQYFRRHPAILADEMGLGKTIQIISFLSVLHSDWAIGPFLIVAPNSTISNWKREFQKWAPHMRVAAYYGTAASRSVVREYEIVHNDTSGKPLKVHALITSYNTIESEASFLKQYTWACLVVDEGQRLKNDESILFKLLSEFRVNHRVLLTGTPLQNNTKELFNLLQFLDPKKMNAESLEAHYDIEKQESLSELHQMLQPYFLRRTKTQVLKFLPPKNEVIVPVTMSALQKELYKTILSKNAELMRLVMSRASSGKPIQNYNNTSLGNVLQQIRKILSHPFIYSPDIEEKVDDEAVSLTNLTNACAKLQLLKVLLPLLKAKGHRVLIFCQFVMMLDILEDWLNASGIQHARIDGNTPSPERQEAIDQFNAPNSPLTCFLLSTRAGGVGINLATADTVIIYDADFNPHQDLQAVARAHRIGQKSKVVVFTLVTRNTAEEKILQIGRKKMVLDQLIIENMATKEENVPYQEILSFGAAALFEEEAKNELVYDTATVNNLIESSYADVPVVEEQEAEKVDSFGFAKVWAGDALADEELGEADSKEVTDDLWAKILAQRAAEAKAEADKKSAEFSKGRKRTVKDYSEAAQGKPIEMSTKGKKKAAAAAAAAGAEKANSAANTREPTPEKPAEPEPEPEPEPEDWYSSDYVSEEDDDDEATVSLRDEVPLAEGALPGTTPNGTSIVPEVDAKSLRPCKVCNSIHAGGQCQLRNIPIEICSLCNEAHFSGGRTHASQQCRVFSDVTAMRKILEDLRSSNEPPAVVDKATAYIRSLIGAITRQERDKRGKELQQQQKQMQQPQLSNAVPIVLGQSVGIASKTPSAAAITPQTTSTKQPFIAPHVPQQAAMTGQALPPTMASTTNAHVPPFVGNSAPVMVQSKGTGALKAPSSNASSSALVAVVSRSQQQAQVPTSQRIVAGTSSLPASLNAPGQRPQQNQYPTYGPGQPAPFVRNGPEAGHGSSPFPQSNETTQPYVPPKHHPFGSSESKLMPDLRAQQGADGIAGPSGARPSSVQDLLDAAMRQPKSK